MEELQPVQEPVESPAPEEEPAAAEPAAEIPAAEPLPPPDWEHRMALERADRQLDDQLRQIGRLAPEVARFEDLTRMPDFDKFDRLVRGGLDLVSAFKLTQYDRLMDRQVQAARQAALNAARSTGHLAPAGGRARPEEGLTDEELDTWAKFGLSREEARRYHRRFSGR